MIRTYYLPVIRQDNTDVVLGIEYIHDALMELGEDPAIRRLIMDTTPDEHDLLAFLSISWDESTPGELLRFSQREINPPPTPEYLRACELLGQSPAVITQPEMWELLRIYGKRLGYEFE